ncbi:MAG: restriction endonuclease [Deltaproteobacteria bacterium]|nr:restriction endonuclease [Deltaproteobacteria bacterium]
MSKKKVFISHNHEDQAKVHLLKGQLTNSTEIDITFVSEPPVIGSEIQKSINAQIDQSSLMLVMLGENWSRWQEYEVNNALKKSIPVVGVFSNENNKIIPPVFTSDDVPIVNWNWNEISKVLSGEAHTVDYKAPDDGKFTSPIIQLNFSKISEELTAFILNNPSEMYNISSRKFEELVAYIMERHGYKVTLTQQSRDGGIDIFALKNEGLGNILTIVDCKKYSETNPVGIAAVRGMYGTLQIESASHGMIATTSRFTRDATKLAHEYKYQLSLKDHADILRWIQNTKI